MFKLYNSRSQITSELSNFIKKVYPDISKPHLKLVPNITLGLVKSESVVTTDIIKTIKSLFGDVLFSSAERRLQRFFNNEKFDPYIFWQHVIEDVVSRHKLKNEKVYIAFDHTYCKNSFTVFFLSLRIGKQGIPLWFRCFSGTENQDAFSMNLINEGISYVHNLFKDKKCKLIFLADRWFNLRPIMQHIQDLGDTYYIRTKSNVAIKINNYEYADTISYISDIEATYSKSRYFDDVEITQYKFPTKLAVSKSKSHKEPFYIFTNGNTREAIKSYGYRFGAIEFCFKNQKSNRVLFGEYKSA